MTTNNPLAGLTTSNDVNEEQDRIGGSGAIDSGVYPVTINKAFIGYSKGKAMSLTVHAETDDGFEVRNTLWMTSGEAKGCKNYYEDRNGNKQYLPGFNVGNGLCLLTCNKEISAMEIEDRVELLYDFEEKKEVEKAVPTVIGLIGKKVAMGIIKEIVDKTQLSDATGEYEPTGETREQNEIDKLFDIDSGRTIQEIRAKQDEPVFLKAWKDKWTGQVRNKAKGVAGGAAKDGALQKKGESQSATKSLFGK